MNINDLVFESFTIAELEQNSLSNRSGKIYCCNTMYGTELTFHFNENESYQITISKPLNQIIISESLNGEFFNSQGGHPRCGAVGRFSGGGSITDGHGIDFTFDTTLFPGKYEITEKSGFPNAPVQVRRIS